MPRTPQKSRRPASVPSAHHRRAASHASGLAGDGRATRAGGGGGGGGSALSLTPATPQNTAAAAAARQYRHTDEPPRQGRLSRMYLASLPRPRLGAMTAYLARTEQRMQQKREAAELDHAKRTIIDAMHDDFALTDPTGPPYLLPASPGGPILIKMGLLVSWPVLNGPWACTKRS